MKRYIKHKIEKFIFRLIKDYFNQEIRSNSIDHPIFIGTNSRIKIPLKVAGDKFITIGNNTSIGKMAWIEAINQYESEVFKPSIIIENDVCIGNYACITAINKIQIKNGCLISDHFYVSDHSHGFDPIHNLNPINQNLISKGHVVIGERSFIGYRVTILPGVNLGKNCVVGSHSVVTKSFPDNSMVAGAPAKLIKTFSFELNKWINV